MNFGTQGRKIGRVLTTALSHARPSVAALASASSIELSQSRHNPSISIDPTSAICKAQAGLFVLIERELGH